MRFNIFLFAFFPWKHVQSKYSKIKTVEKRLPQMLEWRKYLRHFELLLRGRISCYSSSETWQLLFIPKETVFCNRSWLQH